MIGIVDVQELVSAALEKLVIDILHCGVLLRNSELACGILCEDIRTQFNADAKACQDFFKPISGLTENYFQLSLEYAQFIVYNLRCLEKCDIMLNINRT